MKFLIKKDDLKKEFRFINKVIERKSTIPVLVHVLIETDKNKIRLTGTNLDIFIVTECESEVFEAGSCAVNSRRLARILSVCETEVNFSFEQNEYAKNYLIVSSGKAQWRLETVSKEQFPEVHAAPDKFFEMPFHMFGTALKQTSFALSKEHSRFVLQGAKFDLDKNKFMFCATDGHRLARSEFKLKNGKTKFDGLIHYEALSVLNLLPKTEVLGIAENDFHWIFKVDNRIVFSRKLQGNFPKVDEILAAESKFTAKFDVIALTEALKQADITTSNTSTVAWHFREGIAEIESSDYQDSFKTQIVCSGDAEGRSVGFNIKYLLDYCKVVKSGVCRIGISDAGSMCVFELTEQAKGESYKYVVMPQRI